MLDMKKISQQLILRISLVIHRWIRQKNLKVIYVLDSLLVRVLQAASVAAVLSIINQKKTDSVDVLLPKKSRITININSCKFEKNKAHCSVIKDAGDDPDVSHGAEIVVDLELTPNPNSIEIDGGEGVGRSNKTPNRI